MSSYPFNWYTKVVLPVSTRSTPARLSPPGDFIEGLPMFERLLRLKVIVPALAAMVVVTVTAHVVFGAVGLVAAIALCQLMMFGVLMMVGRGHRLLLRSNREQLQRANRRLVELEAASVARHEEVVRQLGEVAKSIRSQRRQRVEEHREAQAWRKGVGAQLKSLKERQVTPGDLDEAMREQAEETASAIVVGGRKQYAQLDALSGLYYGLKPPQAFPGSVAVSVQSGSR